MKIGNLKTWKNHNFTFTRLFNLLGERWLSLLLLLYVIECSLGVLHYGLDMNFASFFQLPCIGASCFCP